MCAHHPKYLFCNFYGDTSVKCSGSKTKNDRKMKRKQLFQVGLLLMAVLLLSTSCVHQTFGLSGDIVTEYRPLKGFEKIEISGSPNVYYTQADSFSVKVKGSKDGLENILTDVNEGTLSIRNRGKMGIVNIVIHDEDQAEIYVTSPDLVSVRLSGSGDFTSEKRVDTDQMEIVLRGSGDIAFTDLLCDDCHVELIGSGNIDIKRLEAKTSDATLVGSGDIDLDLWHVLSTRLSLKGSGDINADFNDGCQAVDCELRGSGDITLSGVVSRFSKHETGSGDVNVGELQMLK